MTPVSDPHFADRSAQFRPAERDALIQPRCPSSSTARRNPPAALAGRRATAWLRAWRRGRHDCRFGSPATAAMTMAPASASVLTVEYKMNLVAPPTAKS